MSVTNRSTSGSVALIEPDNREPPYGADGDPITGVVDSWSETLLTISGVDSSDLPEGAQVVISIFAPDALYRGRAVAHWAGTDRLTMEPLGALERIQRRRWPRYPLNLNVTLASIDSTAALRGIAGQTLDIGMGGVRVQSGDHLPPGDDVTVLIALPDGRQLVARSTVIAVNSNDTGFEYRLAFGQLGNIDTANLAALLEAIPTPTIAGLTQPPSGSSSNGG